MKVMVIEDDAITQKILSQILRRREGYSLTIASSAEEAQLLFQKSFFDLFILDLNLPKMNGLDFSRWLRAQPLGDRIYILVGTAHAGNENGTHTLGQILAAGADDYIAKPYNPELLKIRLDVAETQLKNLNQRKDLEVALQHEKDFVSTVLDTAGALIVVLDLQFKVIRINPAFQSLVGSGADFSVQLRQGLFAPTIFPTVMQRLTRPEENPEAITFETELETVHSEKRYISWRASIIPTNLDREMTIVLCGIDITERYDAQNQLAFLALHDPLTQCHNRNYLPELLKSLQESVRAGGSHALLSLDLDNFKIVNDSAGHAAGDQLLITLVRFFRESIRPNDQLIRFGGDEFIIILNNVSLELARQIAERIRERVDEFVFLFKDKRFTVGVSIGLVLIDSALTPDQIIARADAACYAAKSQGRNRVEVYEESAHSIQQLQVDIDWKVRIREALKENKFQLYFQPITEITTGKVSSYETLLRLFDSDGKQIPSNSFFPAADRLKITPKIDRYVVRKIGSYLKENPELRLSVNLSAQSLATDETIRVIEQVFSSIPGGADRVCFEITETAIISDLETARVLINRLHLLGFRFSLDDFGVGFSSFDYLKKLPIDYLKIDGSFVIDLVNQPVNRAFVKGINQIAHELKIKTVAEYVETEPVLHILRELGIDYAQGFYLGKPAPWEHFKK